MLASTLNVVAPPGTKHTRCLRSGTVHTKLGTKLRRASRSARVGRSQSSLSPMPVPDTAMSVPDIA
eukprot:3941501-Rhodomonas_salina.2